MQVSESEANQILSGFANDDDMTEKTWSRQFVEKYLIHVSYIFYCVDGYMPPVFVVVVVVAKLIYT